MEPSDDYFGGEKPVPDYQTHAGSKAGSPSMRTRETASIRRDAGVGHVQARHALPFCGTGSADVRVKRQSRSVAEQSGCLTTGETPRLFGSTQRAGLP